MKLSSVSWRDIATTSGQNVRIAVIDSGVEITHPAFATRSIKGYKVEALWDRFHRVIPDLSPNDVFGHGTAVTDIICRHAPGARVDSIQVLDATLRASSAKAVAAISWAVEQKYDVINCSFGAAGNEFLLRYKEIVDAVFCSGTILVAACNNLNFRQPEYPGAFPSVISTDQGALEGLSLRRRCGELVEFIAAGRSLHLPWKGGTYRTVTGSSFAAPHVTALCARVRELEPTWNVVQLKACLYALAQSGG